MNNELSPITRYYYGDRDPEARQAQAEQRRRQMERPGVKEAYRRYAQKRRGQPHGPDRETRMQAFIVAIRNGATYTDALAQTGLTTPAITGRRQTDPDYAERLDAALMQGRDRTAGAYEHGTLMGYTHGRCRCPECRKARNAYREK